MNFIQKNPNDPKHEEFHDGYCEYWPVEGGLKSKSGRFPAAVLTGLELVAAAAAAGLLAAVLAVLYIISSPLAITENTATINANVYNNSDNQLISYTLSTAAFPDIILQEGTLEDSKETLHLKAVHFPFILRAPRAGHLLILVDGSAASFPLASMSFVVRLDLE